MLVWPASNVFWKDEVTLTENGNPAGAKLVKCSIYTLLSEDSDLKVGAKH